MDGITNSATVARDFAGTFGVEIKHNLLDPWAQRSKRVLDVGATVIGGALVLLPILILSLLVWMESGRPIFYADKRMGRNGSLFSCVKFRTMVPDAEALLQQVLAQDAEMREEYLKYHKDRKSTRLNSSHANISYAVFCLKKKKITQMTYRERNYQEKWIKQHSMMEIEQHGK